MRLIQASTLVAAVALLVPTVGAFQAGQETDRKVAGGGISVKGWSGAPDANKQGLTVNDAKFSPEGNGFMVITGPAITYWNPANVARGNYTVRATFDEPQYMNINTHAHPYGIVIAGSEIGTPNQSYLYCSAYGDGRFIVRGFSPTAPKNIIRMNGGKGEMNPAINQAAGKGSPVKQDIAMSVRGDSVTCAINGTVVGTYTKEALAAAGLQTTDGIYGLRFGHNTDVRVTNFQMVKN